MPDSATPMKPRIGATMMNAVPMAREALRQRDGHAGEVEHVGQAEDEDADQQRAPHLVERAAKDFAELGALQLAQRQQQHGDDDPRREDRTAADPRREIEHAR